MSNPLPKDPLEVVPTQGNQMIETLPSGRSDCSFANRIGPRAPVQRLDYTRAHVLSRSVEFPRENPAPVVDGKSMGVVTRDSLTELLLGPLGCRVSGCVAMQDLPRSLSQHHENMEDPKHNCCGDEEITGRTAPAWFFKNVPHRWSPGGLAESDRMACTCRNCHTPSDSIIDSGALPAPSSRSTVSMKR